MNRYRNAALGVIALLFLSGTPGNVSPQSDKQISTKALPAPECTAGCSAASPSVLELSPQEIQNCLQEIAAQPVGEASLEMETLLFHFRQVVPFLHDRSLGMLNAKQTQFLKGELARTDAKIRVRVVDADEKVRMDFQSVVPIGIKQHLHPDKTIGFVPPEISFTVQRVGLRHLWTRL